MSCTAPIKIIRKQKNRCNLKCNLWYNYGDSSCLIQNNKDKITVSYDGKSDVMFNSVPYTPTKISIYMPSIHTYDNEYAEGEIVIDHSGGQNGLCICIPITLSDTSSTTKGTTLLEELVKNTLTTSETISLNLQDFNINYLIPKTSYFSYAGTSFSGNSNAGYTCDSTTNTQYVVFHKKHGSVALDAKNIEDLGKLINNAYVPLYEGESFFNEKGTTANGFGGEGQIYIDCQPTGEDEEVVYQQPNIKPNFDWVWAMMSFIIGLFIAWIVYKFFNSSISTFDNKKMSIDGNGKSKNT